MPTSTYTIMATTNTACSVSDQDNSTNGLEPQTKRIRASVLCPHCDQYISKSSYYRHRSAFYDGYSKNLSKMKIV